MFRDDLSRASNLGRAPRITCHPEAAESLAKPRTPNEGSLHPPHIPSYRTLFGSHQSSSCRLEKPGTAGRGFSRRNTLQTSSGFSRRGHTLHHHENRSRIVFMIFAMKFVATFCTGLFAGAALYITVVEHPARMECGTTLAATEFGPSYRRATVMQASLAILSFPAAIASSILTSTTVWLVGGA